MIATAASTDRIERNGVADMQRARLIAAAGPVACEHGPANVRVTDIVARAGVSRRTFYEVFSDSDDCIVSTLHAALKRAQERVLPVWQSQDSWLDRVRGALTELLCLFDEEPVTGRLLIVESLAAGRDVLEERARVLNALIDAVEEGRTEGRTAEAPARVGAEGAVGGVLSVLHSRLSQPPTKPLIELAGVLMSMLVLPYRGPATARRELSRPVATLSGQAPAPLDGDPFKEAGMRLTYRTMRVLSAVAEHPGSSNRHIGELADMHDQGQVSKLLARLERAGLIVNQTGQHAKGDPNAWALTPAGLHVTRKIGAHLEGQTA